MTASAVSRSFAAVLDDTERGETIVVTRGGRRVATITPAGAVSWGALRLAVQDRVVPGDPAFEADVLAVREAVTLGDDPWQQSG